MDLRQYSAVTLGHARRRAIRKISVGAAVREVRKIQITLSGKLIISGIQYSV